MVGATRTSMISEGTKAFRKCSSANIIGEMERRIKATLLDRSLEQVPLSCLTAHRALEKKEQINKLGGRGLLPRAVSFEIIKNWLEPEGYEVRKEDETKTELIESGKRHTDLVAEKGGEVLMIEIEHRSSKE